MFIRTGHGQGFLAGLLEISGHRRRRRRGAMLLVVATMLIALVGMMALTLECGGLMAERRHAQGIADAAAMAAACDLAYNYGFNSGLDTPGTAKSSALSTASASGYTNDGITSIVSVSIPPGSGDYTGQAGYAQVQVAYIQPRGFSGIFGSGSLKVTANAVARGQWSTFPISILALEPILPASMTIAASANITTNSTVDVDSSSILSTAIALAGRITAPTVNLSGNAIALLNGPINAAVNINVAPTPDPLAYLSPPDPSTMTVQRSTLLNFTGSTPLTLQPGVYNGGIRIAGTATVTLAPGIYYLNGGGFTVAATGSVVGTGVMIVNAPILPTDAITIAATGSIQLTPPTSGLYSGITIMQPSELIPLPLGLGPPLTIGANSLFGSSFSISGTIYAPQSNVILAGNNQAKVGSQLICRTATVAANASVSVIWDNNTARTPLPVKLVQ